MNLNTPSPTRNSPGRRRPGRAERSVALVITLLMLSVITFLAIAFLAMTNRDKGAVTAALDANVARSMSDAALARAQAQIVAQMMAMGDGLSYDYTASHNYISNAGFNGAETVYDPTNVNYDTLIAGGGSANGQTWAQNIANLFWDPRPPVFVMTNGNLAQPANDFRYWVDINRNGLFESNGLVQMLDINGKFILGDSNFYNGEPEWIGVLKYPETNHSLTNPFIGRYAFMVLPIGKTLDFNFIHNYSKNPGLYPMMQDMYIRDEGVGSWELNLAALLNDINTNIYPTSGGGAYNYNLTGSPPTAANSGNCFEDAFQFLRFRYGGNLYAPNYPQTLTIAVSNLLTNDLYIDEYGQSPSTVFPFDYNQYSAAVTVPATTPWPGSYNTNMFYDVQDLFDTTKTGTNFGPDLIFYMTNKDSYDRYTFQRLLACIGTGSSPEYGVYVYPNFTTTNAVPTNNGIIPSPSLLRTKVNINYDNTAQLQANQGSPYTPYGSYIPMPTNPVAWTNAAMFFSNAADLLLRSQIFVFTNYFTNSAGKYFVPVNTSSNYTLTTFGITNIPIYSSTNAGILYNEQIHRMLQVAANIYADTHPTNFHDVPQPPVFRPQFMVAIGAGVSGSRVTNIYITNYVQITNNAYNQIATNSGFKDLTDATLTNNDNVWGIPWVIGAVTNIPEFNQYNYQYRIFHQRALHFIRYPSGSGWATNKPPQYTNQFYEMSVSNVCGMDVWYPYNNPSGFTGSSGVWTIVASNFITVSITNNYFYGTNIYYTNATTNIGVSWLPNTFKTFLQTNFISLPYSYFSESIGNFSPLPYIDATFPSTNGADPYLGGDTNQYKSYPTHYWTVSATNHLFYVLYDGSPTIGGSANVLDFVNLGPFGSSFPITQFLQTNSADPFAFQIGGVSQTSSNSWWTISPATDAGGPISQGVLNQINATKSGNIQFVDDIMGVGTQGHPASISRFTTPVPQVGPQYNVIGPYANFAISNSLVACDPLVHYTLGDLAYTNINSPAPVFVWTASDNPFPDPKLTVGTGFVTARYQAGTNTNGMIIKDPGMTSANVWQFPANPFPGIGWLGRVHRGTPWQTIYLKPDDPTTGATWVPWVNSPFTYPTNDWAILDLFTAVPNDNAARGLLSINQANDAAWAAVFAGVIALTNSTGGVVIDPSNDVSNIMEGPNGINAARTNPVYHPNGLFHHLGDLLQASALTTNSPFISGVGVANLTDEMVERIPQQTLSLLKVGMPQFVIYSWGQSLRPKSLYSGGPASLTGICTNYEITGEFLTRTVCHVLNDPGATTNKIIIDSYNIEPGN